MFIIPVARMEGVRDLTDSKKDSAVKVVPEKRFDSVLREAVREADQAIKDTQIMDVRPVSGQVDNLHAALIQAEKAVAATEFTIQITTKAVDAYNQTIGTQV